MKLLYAEDERSLSEAVVDILTYHKYIVDAVYNGEDAYDYAVSGDYDGIILDIMMPGMDGYHTCSVQKQRTAIKHLDFPAAGTIILRSHFPTVN